MKSFEWIDATSIDEASRLLGEGTRDRPVIAKAGGMDLLDLMKEGLLRPQRLVNLRGIADLDEIHVDANGTLRIGALTTLARIASHPGIRDRFGALAAAAEHAATPQVRNVATLGGNLLQRPRCWYFRNEHFAGSDIAAAVREGENQYHGIFDTQMSPFVHASTPATALAAYDATVHVCSSRGQRQMKLRDFLLPPDPRRARDVRLEPDEVVMHVSLAGQASDTRSAYRKQTERDSYDWPICDVALVMNVTPAFTVDAVAIALGWVAPTPMRASEAEAMLTGQRIDESLAARAARAAVKNAQPLSRNAWKVDVLEAVIRRTILEAADG